MPLYRDDTDSPDTLAARALGSALEPLVGSVYFAPECHDNYARLGFARSTALAGNVQLPDGPAYFTSRGSVMGQVPGHLVAAAFAVFNPAAVIPSVAYGWTLTDAHTICMARRDGAIAQLERILGPEPEGAEYLRDAMRRVCEVLRPEGRPLYAGLASQAAPETVLGELWWLGDQLREFRGDSHTAAWISADLHPIEIGLLTELWWNLPLHSYVRTRAWSEEQVAEAMARLEQRGLIANGAFADVGRVVRRRVEDATDQQMRPVLRVLGDELDRVIRTFTTLSEAVRSASGYLAGPKDIAREG
jgi:hypothetical protein